MLSEKQKKIFGFSASDYDALICDGAIRSGKTVWMTVAFVADAMERFSGQRFGICGKTVDSAVKNIIDPYITAGIYHDYGFSVKWRRADKVLVVERKGRKNLFEVFGGKDEASFMLIQGRTLAGVLLDEVALMPRSFVEQALARCSVNGSKFWFNCNPEGQLHWFNQEWIKHPERHNALHLHFTLDDNPSLSDSIKRRYESSYSGVFYDRYIKGLWVSADGVIYDMFDRARHVVPADAMPETQGDYYVSSDFGIQNATVFLLWRRVANSDGWLCLREYYYSGRDEKRQKTAGELVEGLKQMLAGIIPKRVIIDPSAAALIVELRRAGYTTQQANNDVLDGIADVSTMLQTNRLLFSDSCKSTIDEFGIYAWDAKAAEHGEDKPIKENDHAMDATRYLVRTLRLVNRTKEREDAARAGGFLWR